MDLSKKHLYDRFYQASIQRIHKELSTPNDLCFVYVQHAFLPYLDYLKHVDARMAAIIPKGSSASANPRVVSNLRKQFGPRVLDDVTRTDLEDPAFAIHLLRNVTRGRPFAILEYGGYFAPAAQAIAQDPILGDKLVGIVEGTENGIKGSDDGRTLGYNSIADKLSCPVVSKSRSPIKHIMDMEIGPTIVYSSNQILARSLGCHLKNWVASIGVVGVGSIGRSILSALNKQDIQAMVHDIRLDVMAEMAYQQHNIVSQRAILANCDVLFLNTGSCFLSHQPDLLADIKDSALLILCTSGEVEAGIPQLIASGHIKLVEAESTQDIAVYSTCFGKRVRIMLGSDGIGQAPNMTIEEGSASPVNLMSDMEFYAIGCYLGSQQNQLLAGHIHPSPKMLQDLILEEWLKELYPGSFEKVEEAEPELLYAKQ